MLDEDPLMLATRLRAHLVEMPEEERQRLIDAILEPIPDNPDYEFYGVRLDPPPYEDKRPYAGYYCYVKGKPRTLEEWKR